MVISCDRPPTALAPLTERLRSRFAAGLIADIQPPPKETREAILRDKASRLACPVPDDVITLLSTAEAPSVREMESRLLRVVAWADLTGQPLSTELASQALDRLPSAKASPPPAPQAVLEAVTSHYGLSPSALAGRARDRNTSLARRMAMYLLWEVGLLSPTTIARMIGGRDPSAVHQAHTLIALRLPTDTSLQRNLTEIRSRLGLPTSP